MTLFKNLSILMLASSLAFGACASSQKKTTADNQDASGTDDNSKTLQQKTQDNQQEVEQTCKVTDVDEELNVVVSLKDDWFMSVGKTAAANCDIDKPYVSIELGGIKVVIVTEPFAPGKNFEESLKEAIGKFSGGLSEGFGTEVKISYEQKTVGELKRAVTIGHSDIVYNNQKLHLIEYITGNENVDGNAIYHFATWILPEQEYLADVNQVTNLMEIVSTSWMRLSDLDEEGNIIKPW